MIKEYLNKPAKSSRTANNSEPSTASNFAKPTSNTESSTSSNPAKPASNNDITNVVQLSDLAHDRLVFYALIYLFLLSP